MGIAEAEQQKVPAAAALPRRRGGMIVRRAALGWEPWRAIAADRLNAANSSSLSHV